MKSFITCLFTILLFAACQNTSSKTTSEESSTPQEEATPARPAPVEKPKAEIEDAAQITYLQTAVGKIPVYKSFEGVEYLFEQKNDTTYVINFWATWCKPCVEELPYFETLQENYKNDKVQVVLVSLDFKKQLERKLKPFLEKRKLQSQVVVLADSKYNNWIDRVDEEWSGAIPVTVVYDADKREFIGEQFADFEELEQIVKQFTAS